MVKYIGETKSNGLTHGKLYGVETDIDIVEYLDDLYVTVWDDNGHLHEIMNGEYEVNEGEDWENIVPKTRYIEHQGW